MLKNRTHRFRKMSSAAIIGLAIYGSSMSPVWASELRQIRRQDAIKIERVERNNLAGEITVGDGVVKSVGQGSLVVTRKKDSKDFLVQVDDKTKIFRGFGKKIEMEQVLAGHRLLIKGIVAGGDGSTIQARIIRDLSLKNRM